MFLANPGVLAAGAGGKTYAEFVDHIAGLSTSERVWTDTAIWSAGSYLTTAAALAGGMTGSSWMAPFRGIGTATAICRVVQHGLASLTDLNDQISSGRKLLVRVSASSAPTGYAALDRNGFLSSTSGSTLQPYQCDEILAWIGGRPMRMQPRLGLGPTPYDW